MNRLSGRNKYGMAYTKIPLNKSYIECETDKPEICYTGFIADRLAAYEDTHLDPNEIKALVERESAAVADLESCRLDHVRTCANYQKCFDKAKEEFRMMPCMSKNCPGWEWRGPQPPKEEK